MTTRIGEVLSLLDREIWIVTAAAGDDRSGLVATFVSSASIVPEQPRMLVGIAKSHFTWELIERSGRFAMHLIDETQIDLVERFGTQSGREVDKFAGVPLHDDAGPPVLKNALCWLTCKVETTLDTGDRTVYLAAVTGGARLRNGPPLTVSRLLEVASPALKETLGSQRSRDAEQDAEAIARLRSDQSAGSACCAPSQRAKHCN